MVRMTTLKISLLSAFAALFLLVAMLASSGTASAHTANSLSPSFKPKLYVYDVKTINRGCKEMFLRGIGFGPGPVHSSAFGYKYPLTLTPNNVPANVDGFFSQDLIMCGDGFGSPYAHALLIAKGSNLVFSNIVMV